MSPIRVMSDLHLEFLRYKWKDLIGPICKTAKPNETLVLCGDISSNTNILIETLRAFSDSFAHVVMVCGNHEFYGNERDYVLRRLRNLERHASNFHFLENNIVTIDDQRFIGTTLWFADDPMNQLHEHKMNDFWSIPKFHSWNYQVANEAKKFLTENMQPHDIVVSHHLPSNQLVQGEYKTNVLNRFFVHDCERLITTYIPKLWCFGHTHTTVNEQIGDTKFLANPRGYPREHRLDMSENRNFNSELTI